MLDADTFLKHSPFQITHGPNQMLDNTTPELLKFSLQEQHRNKLRELKDNHHDLPNLNLLHSQFLQDSFNNHLQKSIDEGLVLFDTTSNITSSNSDMSMSIQLLPDTSTSSIFNNQPNQKNTNASIPQSFHTFDEGVINKPNYLNLKVLIENSVFDTKNINKDSILSLTALKKLKIKIVDKQELRDYLQSKFAISQEFMTTMILNPEKYHELDIDNNLLLKIIKLNHNLQQQLFNVVEQLDKLNTKLNNHNFACLVLGYVEDIKITSLNHQRQAINQSNNSQDGRSAVSSPVKDEYGVNSESLPSSTRDTFSLDNNKSFETLFSHIASIAVKKNIALPSPPNVDDIDSKIEWAMKCIDSMTNDNVVSSRGSTSTPTDERSQYINISPPHNNDKMLSNYKTALNDLRFSHQYLTKEYEYSKETSFKVIQELRKKNNILEKEIAQFHQQDSSFHESMDSGISKSNPTASAIQQDLFSKEKEITKLRKELNLLKIDNLGSKSPGLSISPTQNYGNQHLIGSAMDNSDNEDGFNASKPVSTSGMSNGILRKEFKKIIGDLQDQFEVELGEERLRRRKLEEQVKRLESASLNCNQ